MTTAALATSFAGLATLAPLAMAASAFHSAAFRHLIGCWLLYVYKQCEEKNKFLVDYGFMDVS